MQLKQLKYFVRKVLNEGNALQKRDVKGRFLTTKKFTQTQILSIIISIFLLIVIPRGFSTDFAGYIISFLGIFIGLFTGIAVSIYDKSLGLQEKIDSVPDIEKPAILAVRNYLKQFTALTAYSILISIGVIILLSIVLLSNSLQLDLTNYHIISGVDQINYTTLSNFLIVMALLLHRFFVMYFLINFFVVTLYSTSSYFSFLLSEYNKIRIKKPDAV